MTPYGFLPELPDLITVREQIEKGATADTLTAEEEDAARMLLAETFIDTFWNVSHETKAFSGNAVSIGYISDNALFSPLFQSTLILRSCLGICTAISITARAEHRLQVLVLVVAAPSQLP